MDNVTVDNRKCGPNQQVVTDDEEPSAKTESGWLYTGGSELYRLVAGKPDSDMRMRDRNLPPPPPNPTPPPTPCILGNKRRGSPGSL